MGQILLRNGRKESFIMVTKTMMSLQALLRINPIALYELNQLARDPSHQLLDNTGEVLRQLNLVGEDGRMYDSIRNVVQSAVVGEGPAMKLRRPGR